MHCVLHPASVYFLHNMY